MSPSQLVFNFLYSSYLFHFVNSVILIINEIFFQTLCVFFFSLFNENYETREERANEREKKRKQREIRMKETK